MALTWDKILEIGNPNIDNQHKKLIEMFNVLINACSSGKGQAKLEDSFNFLIEYSIQHFSDEEAWQYNIGYPEYQKHKKSVYLT